MNSTEVQNLRRKLDDVFMLIICVWFCSCLCKVCSRVSEAFLLALRALSLITLPQTLRLPNSCTSSIACTTVLHCGHTFWAARKRQSQMSKFDRKATILHAQVTWSHITLTHVRWGLISVVPAVHCVFITVFRTGGWTWGVPTCLRQRDESCVNAWVNKLPF